MKDSIIYLELSDVEVCAPGGERPLLKNMNCRIFQGEWVGVVGTNGSGKSVLARVLAGLERNTKGTVRLSDDARLVQLVMQNPDAQLIGDTVYEDLCFGMACFGVPNRDMKARANSALRRVGLEGMEQRTITTLSGGQKQLLALAGMLVLEPRILVVDEVTSMLDPASRQRILGVLTHLHREGTTIVMVTQQLEELALAERVIALGDGQIVFEGSRETFFYGTPGNEDKQAPCEAAGLQPPLTVAIARELLRLGQPLSGLPVTPEELEEAVNA